MEEENENDQDRKEEKLQEKKSKWATQNKNDPDKIEEKIEEELKETTDT